MKTCHRQTQVCEREKSFGRHTHHTVCDELSHAMCAQWRKRHFCRYCAPYLSLTIWNLDQAGMKQPHPSTLMLFRPLAKVSALNSKRDVLEKNTQGAEYRNVSWGQIRRQKFYLDKSSSTKTTLSFSHNSQS